MGVKIPGANLTFGTFRRHAIPRPHTGGTIATDGPPFFMARAFSLLHD